MSKLQSWHPAGKTPGRLLLSTKTYTVMALLCELYAGE